MFEVDTAPSSQERSPIPVSEVDLALTAQIVVAWAGEAGEEARLGWWRSDLTSEYGGHDLFRRLLPGTWAWAVLQGAREAARRRDAELRRQDHDPDRIVSLYHLGSEMDERVEERLMDLKRRGLDPKAALPGLSAMSDPWNATAFLDWVAGHGSVPVTAAPIGRWLKGEIPVGLDQQVRRLVAGLAPLSASYPLPHFRRVP